MVWLSEWFCVNLTQWNVKHLLSAECWNRNSAAWFQLKSHGKEKALPRLVKWDKCVYFPCGEERKVRTLV